MEQPNNKTAERPALAKTIGGSGQGSMKIIRGPAGGMLLVYEAGADSARVLVFEWAGRKTELRDYPAHWRTLKDAELLTLHREAANH